MKNFCIIFLTITIIILTAVGFSGKESTTSTPPNADYLRIHIRADSNESQAQAVKYLVRDGVVEYLTPLVANAKTKERAYAEVEKRLPQLQAVAEKILRENGYAYGASASLKQESFPTRVYGEYVLPAGEYSALVLRLGKGEGDNWWCVVYPPLCFTGGSTPIVYKSKIQEIIASFYQK